MVLDLGWRLFKVHVFVKKIEHRLNTVDSQAVESLGGATVFVAIDQPNLLERGLHNVMKDATHACHANRIAQEREKPEMMLKLKSV